MLPLGASLIGRSGARHWRGGDSKRLCPEARAFQATVRPRLDGEVYIPAAYRTLAEPGTHSPEHIVLKRLRDLTPQQLTVLDMIREGKQNKQIAHELKLAETTVKAHVSEILRKLNVFTRTNAVIEVAKVDFAALRAGGDSGE